jgi:exonuclease III
MKILTFNCRGVASLGKKLTLHRLVESTQPDILLLQETLGDSIQVIPLLGKICKGWNFTGLDSRGASGDSIGWHSISIKLINDWGFDSGLGIKVFVEELGSCLTILNVYGPSQDRIPFGIIFSTNHF